MLAKKRQEEVKSRIKAVDMPKDIQDASFKNFERTDGRSYASFEALDFVEHYSADPKGYHKGLYLVCLLYTSTQQSARDSNQAKYIEKITWNLISGIDFSRWTRTKRKCR